jgi:hypothetical protein
VFLIVSWSKPEPYKRHITISVQGPACDLLVPVGIDIVDLPALRPDRPTTYKMASMYHTCVAPPRMNDDDIVTQGSDTEEGTNDGVGPPPYHAGTDIKHGICCYICTSYKTTTWFKMMEHVRRLLLLLLLRCCCCGSVRFHKVVELPVVAAVAVVGAQGVGRGRGSVDRCMCGARS